jgi:hypothetical protein
MNSFSFPADLRKLKYQKPEKGFKKKYSSIGGATITLEKIKIKKELKSPRY